jgi:hypothetical protein
LTAGSSVFDATGTDSDLTGPAFFSAGSARGGDETFWDAIGGDESLEM